MAVWEAKALLDEKTAWRGRPNRTGALPVVTRLLNAVCLELSLTILLSSGEKDHRSNQIATT